MDESEFPVKVDLGREVEMPVPMETAPSKGKTKKRTEYPRLYIKGLAPKEGVALIRFRRCRFSEGDKSYYDADEGQDASSDLEVHEIMFQEEPQVDQLTKEIEKAAKARDGEDEDDEGDEDEA